MKPKPKKRNTQDLTLLNLRALKKRLEKLEAVVMAMKQKMRGRK